MIIQHNLSAMNVQRQYNIAGDNIAKHTEKLSSGYQINRAADDAAGLTISEKMRRQIRGLTQASQNCQDGISMVQTAEGALNEVHNMLQRMNELAIQSANGTNTASDRAALQAEFEQIQREIDRVSESVTFNDMHLFKGATTEVQPEVDETSVVQVGGYNVIGGTEGVDFVFRNGRFDILSDTPIIIQNSDPNSTSAVGIAAINQDANITLDGVHIKNEYLRAYGNCTVNLTLLGDNSIINGNGNGAVVLEGATLNISGPGTLTIEGARAGIAVFVNSDLNISSGTVNATGSSIYAGIGGVRGSNTMGNVTITGGTVTATGGSSGAAGIGSAYASSGGNITITGGNVTAIGGVGASAIGNGRNSNRVTFSTGSDGNATITVSNADGDTDIADLISDTSKQDEWKAVINDANYGEVNLDAVDAQLWEIQAGAEDGHSLTVRIGNMNASVLGVARRQVSVKTQQSSLRAISSVSDAIDKVSEMRSSLGAYQNRLEHTVKNLDNVVENTTSAESRIRDMDIAEEMLKYSKEDILRQAMQVILSQANIAPGNVLGLLR